MFKLKFVNFVIYGYFIVGSLVDVCKWIVVVLDGLEYGVV